MHYTYEIEAAANGFTMKRTNKANGLDSLFVFPNHAALTKFMADEVEDFKAAE